MEIIRKRRQCESVEYQRHFEWRDMPGAGFGFNCNETGDVDVDKLTPAGAENYRKCLDGTHDVTDQGVQRYEHSWIEPAVGRCCCSAKVELDGFTNTCDRCGRDYNMSGQLLAPREQWGEETGETPGDILNIR